MSLGRNYHIQTIMVTEPWNVAITITKAPNIKPIHRDEEIARLLWSSVAMRKDKIRLQVQEAIPCHCQRPDV